MKRINLLILLLAAGQLHAQRILFIGNSYTYTNNLPQMFTNLAAAGGKTVTTDMSAPGGYTLQQHTTDATTLSKIAQGNWDYVIIQEQSQIPSFPQSQVQTDCYPYARQLDSLVRVADSCAETVFYMTWGRKYGDAGNCGVWPPVCTFSGMQSQLRYSYLQLGIMNHATIAPVGEAWRESWFTDSTINLWIADNSHPSVAGSYLAACVFYATLYGETPVGLSYTGGLATADANFLQLVAASTVLDSAAQWQLAADHPQISLTSQQMSGFTYQFTSEIYNADTAMIAFNGGNFNALDTGMFTWQTVFPGPGTYTFDVVAQNHCFSDTLTQTLVISPSGIVTVSATDETQLYPNPVSSFLHATGTAGMHYTVNDVAGRKMCSGISNGMIDFSALVPGCYYVTFFTQNGNSKTHAVQVMH